MQVKVDDVDFEYLVSKLEREKIINLKEDVGEMTEKDMEHCGAIFVKLGYRTTRVFKGDGEILGNVYVVKLEGL